MLKKSKHKFKRRNTEPMVNHSLVASTPSAGAAVASGQQQQQQQQQPPVNLADICDSPTHATAV